jgi:hypothetical protein
LARVGVRRLLENDFEGTGDGLLGANGFTLGAPVTLNLGYQGEFVLHHDQTALVTNGSAEAAAVTKRQINYRFFGQIMSSVLKPIPVAWLSL